MKSIDELEAELGQRLRAYRLDNDLDQRSLAARSGISLTALQSLERGRGSSLHTLLSVVRALGRDEWLDHLAPVAAINPLAMTATARKRQRARRVRGRTP